MGGFPARCPLEPSTDSKEIGTPDPAEVDDFLDAIQDEADDMPDEQDLVDVDASSGTRNPHWEQNLARALYPQQLVLRDRSTLRSVIKVFLL